MPAKKKWKATDGASVAEVTLRPKSTRKKQARSLMDDAPSYDGAGAGLARRAGNGGGGSGNEAQLFHPSLIP